VAEIQRLFDLRSQMGPPEATFWSVVQRTIFTHLEVNFRDYLPFLMVGLTPSFPIEPITIDDTTDEHFQTLCWRMFHVYDGQLLPEAEGIAYTVGSADRLIAEQPPYACAYSDGAIGARHVFSYDKNWETERPEMVRPSITHMWKRLREMLEAIASWPREQGAYDGPLICRIAVGNLSGTIAVLPRDMERLAVTVVHQPLSPTRMSSWQYQVEWDQSVPIDDLLEPLMAKLARQLQFSLFRPFRERIRTASKQS